jgi:hypothetical protein
MVFNRGISFIVGSSTVAPSVFVTQVGVSAYSVQQCGANGVPIGISQEGTRSAPDDENAGSTYAGAYTGTAGYTGDPIQCYTLGDVCLLTLGTTVTVGAQLASDANGKGVLGTTGQNLGAEALEAGNAGDLIRVQVVLGKVT